MSVIEDSRKVIQDFLAPELQELKAEIRAADERSRLRDEALSAEIRAVDERSKLRDEALSAKIDHIDEKSRLRDEALSDKIDSKFDLLIVKIDSLAAAIGFDRRLEAVEKKVAGPMRLPSRSK